MIERAPRARNHNLLAVGAVLAAYAVLASPAYAPGVSATAIASFARAAFSWTALAAPALGLVALQAFSGARRLETPTTLAAVALFSAFVVEACALAFRVAGFEPSWMAGAAAPSGLAGALVWIGRTELASGGAEAPRAKTAAKARSAARAFALFVAALASALFVAALPVQDLRPRDGSGYYRLSLVAVQALLLLFLTLRLSRPSQGGRRAAIDWPAASPLTWYLAAAALDYAALLPLGPWAPVSLAAFASAVASAALALSALGRARAESGANGGAR